MPGAVSSEKIWNYGGALLNHPRENQVTQSNANNPPAATHTIEDVLASSHI